MNTFIIYLIVLTPTVGLFIATIITISLKGWKRFIITIILAVIIGTIFSGGFALEATYNFDIWNDGYCTCGGIWEFKNASRYRNKTTYYWECDTCKTIIETDYNFR